MISSPSGATEKWITFLFLICVLTIAIRAAKYYCSCNQNGWFYFYEIFLRALYHHYKPVTIQRTATFLHCYQDAQQVPYGAWHLVALRIALLKGWFQATHCSECWLRGFPSQVPQSLCTWSHIVMGCGAP